METEVHRVVLVFFHNGECVFHKGHVKVVVGIFRHNGVFACGKLLTFRHRNVAVGGNCCNKHAVFQNTECCTAKRCFVVLSDCRKHDVVRLGNHHVGVFRNGNFRRTFGNGVGAVLSVAAFVGECYGVVAAYAFACDCVRSCVCSDGFFESNDIAKSVGVCHAVRCSCRERFKFVAVHACFVFNYNGNCTFGNGVRSLCCNKVVEVLVVAFQRRSNVVRACIVCSCFCKNKYIFLCVAVDKSANLCRQLFKCIAVHAFFVVNGNGQCNFCYVLSFCGKGVRYFLVVAFPLEGCYDCAVLHCVCRFVHGGFRSCAVNVGNICRCRSVAVSYLSDDCKGLGNFEVSFVGSKVFFQKFQFLVLSAVTQSGVGFVCFRSLCYKLTSLRSCQSVYFFNVGCNCGACLFHRNGAVKHGVGSVRKGYVCHKFAVGNVACQCKGFRFTTAVVGDVGFDVEVFCFAVGVEFTQIVVVFVKFATLNHLRKRYKRLFRAVHAFKGICLFAHGVVTELAVGVNHKIGVVNFAVFIGGVFHSADVDGYVCDVFADVHVAVHTVKSIAFVNKEDTLHLLVDGFACVVHSGGAVHRETFQHKLLSAVRLVGFTCFQRCQCVVSKPEHSCRKGKHRFVVGVAVFASLFDCVGQFCTFGNFDNAACSRCLHNASKGCACANFQCSVHNKVTACTETVVGKRGAVGVLFTALIRLNQSVVHVQPAQYVQRCAAFHCNFCTRHNFVCSVRRNGERAFLHHYVVGVGQGENHVE